MRVELTNLIEFTRELYQTQDFTPLHEPRFIGREKELVVECIDSTFVSSLGKFAAQFERQIAKYTSIKHAVATVSGTSIFYIALLLENIERHTGVVTIPSGVRL